MNKHKEDLINGVLMVIIFTGAAAAGATILAAEINQVFTYISARLAMYTTQTRAPVHLSAAAVVRLAE